MARGRAAAGAGAGTGGGGTAGTGDGTATGDAGGGIVGGSAGAGKRQGPSPRKPIEQYAHADKQRANNPPVGLVSEASDAPAGRQTYAYDPHLDPQLVWAGRAEHQAFAVPTVSLHVHERIDPRTIVEAVRRSGPSLSLVQGSLFQAPQQNPPLREALEFYRHPHGWTNRLVAGDSLLVMNSLLEKEGLGGQVQMVYVDPPYLRSVSSKRAA